jgi:hypothetical protein
VSVTVADNRGSDRAAGSRIAVLEAELEARLRQCDEPERPELASLVAAMNGGQVPTIEERKERAEVGFIESTSYSCPQCGYVFTEGDVVYRRRETTHLFGRAPFKPDWVLTSVCEKCVKEWHPSWFENRREPIPCAGGCGVLVSDWYWSRILTCSRRCTERAAIARKRVTHEERTCEGCGRNYVPTRSDARWCSSACRQRAYRLRAKGGAEA